MQDGLDKFIEHCSGLFLSISNFPGPYFRFRIAIESQKKKVYTVVKLSCVLAGFKEGFPAFHVPKYNELPRFRR